MSREALALRQLAAAIEHRDAVLSFLKDDTAAQLGSASGLTVTSHWASSCVGHKELMAELTTRVRAVVPSLLEHAIASLDAKVSEARGELEAAQREAVRNRLLRPAGSPP